MTLIYVVEDDRNIQEIETFALSSSGYSVRGFDNAKQFYEAMEKELPNLVLLDIMLPDEDGIDILRKIRSRRDTHSIPVIMVTAKTGEVDKVRGLDSGADDYMTKPFGVMELLSRVKAVLRRYHVEKNDSIMYIGNISLDGSKRRVKVNGTTCELTFKEYELLKLLMVNAGIVVSRQVILDKIWGTDFEGESRTLDMHIKTLRQKLREEGALIKTVRNVGYIMNPTGE